MTDDHEMAADELPDWLRDHLDRILAQSHSDEEEVRALAELRRQHPDHVAAIDAWLERALAAGARLLGTAGATEERSPRIGSFKVLEHLGKGGFGTVYLAEQTEPVRRRVAIKVLNPGMDTREILVRFQVEREALNLMNHPSIAKLLDAGETEEGRPYFVMEYVSGAPLREHCELFRLNLEQRLVLFQDVCKAVQHAHQKGVIHRDLRGRARISLRR